MPATYRSVTENDIGEIVAMMRDFYAIDQYPMNEKVSERLFQQFISDAHLGKAWLIFSKNELVGYVILTFVFSFEYGGRIAFLDELYVSEKVRGKSIGKETVDFIKTESKKLEVRLLYLEVEPHNEKAQRLYLSKDFEMHKRHLMQYKIK